MRVRRKQQHITANQFDSEYEARVICLVIELKREFFQSVQPECVDRAAIFPRLRNSPVVFLEKVHLTRGLG
jgi:hypothetical protein